MKNHSKVYLFGYRGRKPGELVALVNKRQAVVMDIRYSPNSRNPAWGKANLIRLLDSHYVSAGNVLGNRNYRSGGPIDIVDLTAGLKLIREQLQRHNVILLCVCANTLICHRLQISNALLDEGIDVDELLPPKPDAIKDPKINERLEVETAGRAGAKKPKVRESRAKDLQLPLL